MLESIQEIETAKFHKVLKIQVANEELPPESKDPETGKEVCTRRITSPDWLTLIAEGDEDLLPIKELSEQGPFPMDQLKALTMYAEFGHSSKYDLEKLPNHLWTPKELHNYTTVPDYQEETDEWEALFRNVDNTTFRNTYITILKTHPEELVF